MGRIHSEKIRIARLVYLAVLEVAEQRQLPDDVPCFMTLVRQYCAAVVPSVTRDEIVKILNTPVAELFLEGVKIE